MRKLRILVPVLLLAAAVLAVIRFGFVIRSVQVVGNRTLSSEDIVELSGVNPGDNYLLVSSSVLKKRLERNRFIEYVGRDYDYTGTLTLRINERLGMGVVFTAGHYFVLDEDGVVLEEISEQEASTAGTEIAGLVRRSQTPVVIGEMYPVTEESQLSAMGHILKALEKANLLWRTSSVNVANADDLYVFTVEEAKIVLGTDSQLDIKMAIAREVLARRENVGGLRGCTIDVSSGRDAHYIPDILPTVTPQPTATPTREPDPTPTKK